MLFRSRLFRLRELPIRAADDFLPGHNLCANGVQCDQYGIVPYEYVPFAAPGYWAPNPTLPTASFYDEFYNEDALDALK